MSIAHEPDGLSLDAADVLLVEACDRNIDLSSQLLSAEDAAELIETEVERFKWSYLGGLALYAVTSVLFHVGRQWQDSGEPIDFLSWEFWSNFYYAAIGVAFTFTSIGAIIWVSRHVLSAIYPNR